MASTVAASRESMRQDAVRTALERKKNIDSTGRLIGALRVAGGESGGVEGSYASLINQAEYDAGLNQQILDANLATGYARTSSGTAAQLAQLRNQFRNPFAAAVKDGIQYAGIANGLGAFDAAPPTPPVPSGSYGPPL